MNISKRLLCISDLIGDCSKVVDIGCDHALLDIYLAINKSCFCTGIDVSDIILSRARDNIYKYGVNDKVNLIVGNGYTDLKLDYDCIMVLSGMGTSTIINILKNNKTRCVICQTNTGQYELRKKVCSMGYYIADERIVFDNNRFYITIKFLLGNKDYSLEDFLLGPILRQNKDDLFLNYIKTMYKKNYLGYIESLKYNNKNNDLYMMMEILEKYLL